MESVRGATAARGSAALGDLSGASIVYRTLLFTDVQGYTGLSERLDPGELHRLMNRYYEVTPLLDAAILEAEESLELARLLAEKLEDYDLTLTVPPFGG